MNVEQNQKRVGSRPINKGKSRISKIQIVEEDMTGSQTTTYKSKKSTLERLGTSNRVVKSNMPSGRSTPTLELRPQNQEALRCSSGSNTSRSSKKNLRKSITRKESSRRALREVRDQVHKLPSNQRLDDVLKVSAIISHDTRTKSLGMPGRSKHAVQQDKTNQKIDRRQTMTGSVRFDPHHTLKSGIEKLAKKKSQFSSKNITVGGISDEDFSEYCNPSRKRHLYEYVEYHKNVQDRAILNRYTNVVRIRDPDHAQLVIATIRDPKVPIDPYKHLEQIINMENAVEDGIVPIFNDEVPPINFDDRKIGWHVILELLMKTSSKDKDDSKKDDEKEDSLSPKKKDENEREKQPDQNEQFWSFINRLRHIRITYNLLLYNKFRALKKNQKQSLEIMTLFNEMVIDEKAIRNPTLLLDKKEKEKETQANIAATRKAETNDSHATKVQKLAEEFERKVRFNLQFQQKRAETTLSASIKEDSHDDALRQPSVLSGSMRVNEHAKSKRSIGSKSTLSSRDNDLTPPLISSTNRTDQFKRGFTDRGLGSMINDADSVADSQYHRGVRANSTTGRKRVHYGGNFDQASMMHQRVSKQDLVQVSHTNPFLLNKFDHYAKEYGQFFKSKFTMFEERLDEHKREIALNTLAEKRTQNNSSTVVQNGNENTPTNEEALKQHQEEADANQKALESKKFPSLAYLRKMGVTNFKPSIHHKVQSGHKMFNILNDKVIAAAEPRIDCTWEGGQPPKWNKSMAKKELELQVDDTDYNSKINQTTRSRATLTAKNFTRAALKARKLHLDRQEQQLKRHPKSHSPQRSTTNQKQHKRARNNSQMRRTVSPANDFSGCQDLAGSFAGRSDDDSVSKDRSHQTSPLDSRNKTRSELLSQQQKKKTQFSQFNKTVQSKESCERIVSGSHSPQPVKLHENNYRAHSSPKDHLQKSLRHSISNKEKQNWKLTQGRRDMVENQSQLVGSTQDLRQGGQNASQQPPSLGRVMINPDSSNSLIGPNQHGAIDENNGCIQNGENKIITMKIESARARVSQKDDDQLNEQSNQSSTVQLPKFKIKANRVQSARVNNKLRKRETNDLNNQTFDYNPSLATFQKFRVSQNQADPFSPIQKMEKKHDQAFKRLKARHWRVVNPPAQPLCSEKMLNPAPTSRSNRNKVNKRLSHAHAQLREFLDEKEDSVQHRKFKKRHDTRYQEIETSNQTPIDFLLSPNTRGSDHSQDLSYFNQNTSQRGQRRMTDRTINISTGYNSVTDGVPSSKFMVRRSNKKAAAQRDSSQNHIQPNTAPYINRLDNQGLLVSSEIMNTRSSGGMQYLGNSSAYTMPTSPGNAALSSPASLKKLGVQGQVVGGYPTLNTSNSNQNSQTLSQIKNNFERMNQMMKQSQERSLQAAGQMQSLHLTGRNNSQGQQKIKFQSLNPPSSYHQQAVIAGVCSTTEASSRRHGGIVSTSKPRAGDLINLAIAASDPMTERTLLVPRGLNSSSNQTFSDHLHIQDAGFMAGSATSSPALGNQLVAPNTYYRRGLRTKQVSTGHELERIGEGELRIKKALTREKKLISTSTSGPTKVSALHSTSRSKHITARKSQSSKRVIL